MGRRTYAALLLPSLFACGASQEPSPGVTPTRTTAVQPSAKPVAATASAPTLDQIWAHVRADIVGCYETGKKAVPEMVDGKITLNASVDAAGKTMCVVPSDDTGLTQDVEDCMRERLGREAYPASGTEWSIAVPIAVRQGAVSLGSVTTQPSIDTIESRGMTEEIYDVIEALLPDAKDCLRGMGKSSERRVVVVGARIGSDGAVACALASSTSVVPLESRRCVANVFARGRFHPPKRGIGLVSIPIEVRGGT